MGYTWNVHLNVNVLDAFACTESGNELSSNGISKKENKKKYFFLNISLIKLAMKDCLL